MDEKVLDWMRRITLAIWDARYENTEGARIKEASIRKKQRMSGFQAEDDSNREAEEEAIIWIMKKAVYEDKQDEENEEDEEDEASDGDICP